MHKFKIGYLVKMEKTDKTGSAFAKNRKKGVEFWEEVGYTGLMTGIKQDTS